ncbi:nucleophile aminohydrolase [Cladorrhinum samala]|uniref:Nucleophile aminohydrolase n=1 Tax=Cladorrhinum samala TaxID=585594 RepID=A0AAV9HP27_9PEZI|nr:nucleophile aminohydrolase [Cladorrhinum samala]
METVPHSTPQKDSEKKDPEPASKPRFSQSLSEIVHRGPDAWGMWVSTDGSVGLAHNCLAINDLSPSGAQPIHDPSGSVHAVVNGEIYDHDRIRSELMGSPHSYGFKPSSDSELVVGLLPFFNDFYKRWRHLIWPATLTVDGCDSWPGFKERTITVGIELGRVAVRLLNQEQGKLALQVPACCYPGLLGKPGVELRINTTYCGIACDSGVPGLS